ncbi:nicotinate-nucleotide--dimethylbenzimidazole phosphoribosyltransferase [Alkalihalophilus lindianensis]|uniref:Nicotinate-nucleotide--dimethylbenzimidazole phosphoribosyltransferase n=1 Tax=Alkalihalophilus lindianensis TaxID=1630542 RepID=A0ABU3X6X0_9BACI|nr:nicotinate-nucleotide--dimethylbenzimidazole phosphoribosyltransferase [Alkalihalophilus lindianensis]MDV2683641.1 nicotinate-nucleotide--dimethylbenzimidazole phosphoribosyltransferase [Alkalihalophilus lindianensis]
MNLQNVIKIPALDKEVGRQVDSYIQTLTKPPGSLGKLEGLAVELAEMKSKPFPVVSPAGVLVFAADHGIAEEGVSAFPQEVTLQMVQNFLNGGAAINVFSRQIGATLKVIDIGVKSTINDKDLITDKVRMGTGNFFIEEAMTKVEAIEAIEIGMRQAESFIINQGVESLILGEMGIANTTASSAILAVLTGKPIDTLVGFGTGITSERVLHKVDIITQSIERRKPNADDPIDVLAKVGGLEIAGMAGAMLFAASYRVPIILDGFISTVAALVASKISNDVIDYMIVSHQSVEPGHLTAIHALGKEPLINLGLRLGEGSGAAVAFPLIESATRMLSEMATFQSAGISDQ